MFDRSLTQTTSYIIVLKFSEWRASLNIKMLAMLGDLGLNYRHFSRPACLEPLRALVLLATQISAQLHGPQ